MEKFLKIIKNVHLFIFKKVLLPINRLLIFHPIIIDFIFWLKYQKLITKLQYHNKTQHYNISDHNLKKGIKATYMQTPYGKRDFVKNYIIGSFLVAETNYKLKKAQPRNQLCNCGSGLKFKKCCALKYK